MNSQTIITNSIIDEHNLVINNDIKTTTPSLGEFLKSIINRTYYLRKISNNYPYSFEANNCLTDDFETLTTKNCYYTIEIHFGIGNDGIWNKQDISTELFDKKPMEDEDENEDLDEWIYECKTYVNNKCPDIIKNYGKLIQKCLTDSVVGCNYDEIDMVGYIYIL
jgi:hypothetical protein